MKLFYLSRARIPSKKAFVTHIHRMCDAFTEIGMNVDLLHPFRWPVWDYPGDQSTESYYDLRNTLSKITLPSLDIPFLNKFSSRLWLWAYTSVYSISVVFFLIYQKIKREKFVIYSRDQITTFILLLLKPVLNVPIFFEVHRVPSSFKNSFKQVWKQADGIVVTTKFIKEALIDEGFDKSGVFVAQDAVDLEKFNINLSKRSARNKVGLPENSTLYTYVGRFETLGKEKGLVDVIKSANHLKVSEMNIKFCFVGGTEEQIENYKSIIDRHNLDPEAFMFFEFRPPSEIPYFLKASDVLLMPFPRKKHFEKYMSPLKMFEYMASKRPIIATRLDSVKTILNHEKNALLAEPDNPKSLTKQIKKLYENEELCERLANNAFKDVKDHTWIRRAEKITGFIKKNQTVLHES